MIKVELPGRNKTIQIGYLLLDLNGTLTKDGVLLDGVMERVKVLKGSLNIYLLTANTMGTGNAVADQLGIEILRVDPEQGGLDKRGFLRKMDPTVTAAIGNGYNDIYMLQEAALGIAVIGPEGCAVEAIMAANIVVNHINDALDLLLNPLRIVATLRA